MRVDEVVDAIDQRPASLKRAGIDQTKRLSHRGKKAFSRAENKNLVGNLNV